MRKKTVIKNHTCYELIDYLLFYKAKRPHVSPGNRETMKAVVKKSNRYKTSTMGGFKLRKMVKSAKIEVFKSRKDLICKKMLAMR